MTVTVDPLELPLPESERPDTPQLTENYCNAAYFPEAGIGLWTHLGRMAGPEGIWRDFLILYLGNGRFALAKGYGRAVHETGPGGSMLRLECDESWQRWTMRFCGRGPIVTEEQLRAGALQDQEHVTIEMDLRWTGRSPVWHLGDRMQSQAWAHFHYEQAHTVTGTVRVGDERWDDLDGTGIRDHSRGTRDFGPMRDHWWLNGSFPSGRSFALLNINQYGEDSHPLRHGYVSDGDKIEEAEVVTIEILERLPGGGPAVHRTLLRTETGQEHVLEGRVLQAMPYLMTGENEIVLGTAHTPEKPLALVECMTEYRFDGEVGYGLTERSWTTTDPTLTG